MDATEVMARYAAAWQSGDPEAPFAFYADDVVMRLPGRSSLAGVHEGREAVVAAIRTLLARTDDSTAEIEVLDTLASDERVALVLVERVVRGDDSLELRRVNLYRIQSEKIVEIDIYEADQYEVDAFFS